MADDFAATADAMLQSATTLHRAGAHRNACYLAGYVVECTLKALLLQAGALPWGHDLESLHDEIAQLYVAGNAIVARYGDPSLLAPTMLQQISPATYKNNKPVHHCHWDPFHRYDGSRWSLVAASSAYIQEAERCYDTIIQMVIDGVI